MRTKKDLSFYVNETPAGSLLKTEALSNHYSKRNLGTTVVENGYVLPSKGWHGEKVDGGVVDCNRTYVPTSGLDEPGFYRLRWDELVLFLEGAYSSSARRKVLPLFLL